MRLSSFSIDRRGASAIELAIALPVITLILMGVIEFGISSLKGQSLQRSLAAATASVQADPLDLSNEQLANTNTSLINFGADGNYVCAISYETLALAQAGDCTGGWNVASPDPNLTSYFILVKGQVSNMAITGLMAPFIGDISDRQVIRVGAQSVVDDDDDDDSGDLKCHGDALNNRVCVAGHSNPLGSICAPGAFVVSMPFCGPNGWYCGLGGSGPPPVSPTQFSLEPLDSCSGE